MSALQKRPVEKVVPKEEILKQYNVPVTEPQPGETAVYHHPEYPAKALTDEIWTLPGVTTMVEFFDTLVKRVGDEPFLGTREKLQDGTFGEYQWMSYKEADVKVKKMAYVLQKQFNVKKEDCVGIWSKNCAEWIVVEYACYMVGALPVALYDTLGPDAVAYVIDHAECSTVFCSADHVQDLLNLCDPSKELRVTNLKDIISFGECNVGKDAIKNDSTQLMAFDKLVADVSDLSGFVKDDPKPTEPCTILYTSGSTGVPKGVVLTHKNIISVTGGLYTTSCGAPFWSGGVHISYLPLAHAYERLVICGTMAGAGRIGFFTGDIKNLISDIGAVKPTYLIGVPRVFQRIHDRIMSKIEGSGFIKKLLFDSLYWWKNSALESAGQDNPRGENYIGDTILFNKVKSLLGGNLKMIFSGAAPLDPKLGSFLRVCFGVPVLQGYGMTETTAGAICGQLFDAHASRHCGGTISCMEFKLRDVPEMGYLSTDQPQPRGELLLRGNNIFKEYYKNPEATADTFDKDGWLCTGDIGTLGPHNEVLIVDRKKNIFKLSQGEYVAPEYLEIVYVRPAIVQQIFVHGDSLQTKLVAVVVPDEEHAKAHAQTKGYGKADITLKELCQVPEFKEDMLALLKEHSVATKLKGIERLHNLHLEHELFSMENNLLTPSFKQRRQQLRDHYRETIAKLYEELEGAHKK